MNRKNEYEAMIGELNRPAPALEAALDRAYRKKRKRTMKIILRPVTGLAACFAVFVLLVNFCVPVAYACSRVPVLRELAEAVTFSRSLTDAVENEYVQPIDIKQTQNDITAEIAYLIVDRKQVNVFYRLDSDKYEKLHVDPVVLSADGTGPVACTYYHSIGFDAENGELRCLSIDFVNNDVPDSLKIRLGVCPNEVIEEAAPEYVADDFYSDDICEEPKYLAKFDFVLEFDPKFTASGKVLPVNQTVILDGQAITIIDIEVYPTHMRVDIQESADNTAWLTGLDFYIETDWGMKFETASYGTIATGSGVSPSMISYRADSTYFYEADHLKLVITGAQWLRKAEHTYLNLVTGEHGELPEGAAFDSAERSGNGWIVRFRADWAEDKTMYQLFGHLFYDADGNEYEIQWHSLLDEADEDGKITCFYDEFLLKNYPYDEVWLSPWYSHDWTAEDLIVITVQ